jgi:hypothetical protein
VPAARADGPEKSRLPRTGSQAAPEGVGRVPAHIAGQPSGPRVLTRRLSFTSKKIVGQEIFEFAEFYLLYIAELVTFAQSNPNQY